MLTRLVTPFALAAALAAPAAADAVWVGGSSVAASASVSASGTISAALSMDSSVAVGTPALRVSPYAVPSVAVSPAAPAPAVTVVPVPAESAVPVIHVPSRTERPAFRIRRPGPPAPVVVPAAPVAVPTGAVHIQPSILVRPIQLALPPPRMIVTSAPAYVAPPSITLAPVVAAPTYDCSDCYGVPAATLAAETPADDDVDLMLFGNYRYLTDGSQVGGASLALRLLLTDELSLEASVGYLAGGTVDGRAREEIPTALNLLWYVAGRGFPLYLGLGVVADWTNVWVDADGCDVDGNADLFRLGARAALGVEWQLLDTFVLTAEAETFVRKAVDGATCDAGPGTPACTEVGVSANLGFGLRF